MIDYLCNEAYNLAAIPLGERFEMSDDVKAKLTRAKRHIQAKEYNKARLILDGVNHPTASKWLKKLDEIAPIPKMGKNKLATRIKIGLIVAGLLFVVLFFVADNMRVQNNVNDFQERFDEAVEWCSEYYTGAEYSECLDRRLGN